MLSVARLTQRPPVQQVQKRIPRPDDPTPRKPPPFFLQELKRAGSVVALGSGVRLRAANPEGDRAFKVPEVPRQMKGDVFGDVGRVETKSGKGKQKLEEGPMINEVAFEKTNKNVSISYYCSCAPPK